MVSDGCAAPLAGALLPCVSCSRTFLPAALARHQRICQKTSSKQRAKFDSQRQRLQGIGIDESRIDHIKQTLSQPLQQPSPLTHQRGAVSRRSAGVCGAAAGSGGSGGARRRNSAAAGDSVPCPHCGRNFGFKAADRHIEWCRDQRSRLAQNNVPDDVRQRAAARNKYQPPLPLGRRGGGRVSTGSSRKSTTTSTTHNNNNNNNNNTTVTAGDASVDRRGVGAVVSRKVGRDYAREHRERVLQDHSARKGSSPGTSATRRDASLGRRSVSPGKETLRRQRSLRRGQLSGSGGTPGTQHSTLSVTRSQRDNHNNNNNNNSSSGFYDEQDDYCANNYEQADDALDHAAAGYISTSQLMQLQRVSDAVTRCLAGHSQATDSSDSEDCGRVGGSGSQTLSSCSTVSALEAGSCRVPCGGGHDDDVDDVEDDWTPSGELRASLSSGLEVDAATPLRSSNCTQTPTTTTTATTLAANTANSHGRYEQQRRWRHLSAGSAGSAGDYDDQTSPVPTQQPQQTTRQCELIHVERSHKQPQQQKARCRGLNVQQMMAGGGSRGRGGDRVGGGAAARFCHQCGRAYPVPTAKFCCGCGTQRLTAVLMASGRHH